MANDLASRQWRLDTPTPFSTGPSSILWQSNVFVENIDFTGYAAQTDQCIIKDRTGRTVWSGTGSTTLAPIRTGRIGWVNGLVLDTLSSGLCVVFIK
jgi:hypothetical protein